jgi:hypothetical protein
MKPRFFAMLPGELQAVVREVEQLAGCEIAVVPNAAANDFDSLAFGVDGGLCEATIAYRGDSPSRCAIVHEVLHLKRYWLDAVPMLRPTTSFGLAAARHEAEATVLNDFIEHLVIIPEERRFAEAESNAHWSVVMAAQLAELPTVGSGLGRAESVALQRSLLLQRAMMDIALPDLDHTGLYDRLRDENLFEASTKFGDSLRDTLGDKMRALVFAAQGFRYDLTAFCVATFNIRANPKRSWRSPPLAHYP